MNEYGHAAAATTTASIIPDVQSSADTRRIAINRVGVKDLRHPVRVRDRSGESQSTVAMFNMYVNLPHTTKGTHMSRFVEILNQRDHELSVPVFAQLLAEMAARLEADHGRIEVRFPFFVDKAAPISGVHSLMDYEVKLVGEITDGQPRIFTQVLVPVTSLCPCSKQISRYGAHNQRSHVTVTVRSSEPVWVQDLIDLVESEASCEVYGLLKRPDEKYVTERAYENPKFVEDMVRDVAARLNADDRVMEYTVESENFESIHNHSAYAMIQHCKDEG